MTATISEIPSAGSAEQESQLVESLALARAGLRAAAEAWNERLRWLRAHAEELFERRHRDIFRADSKAWRADPFASNGVFGTTALSAAWLKDFWKGVFEGLASPLGITYDQAKDIVTTSGGDWRADRIDAVRGCLMGMFLAISARPEAALRHWVADSLGLADRRRSNRRKGTRTTESGQTKGFESAEGATDFETVLARARHFLTTAPKPEKARASLYAIAAEEMEVWPGRAERLKKSYQKELERCVEGVACEELGSAADLRETRRIRRELARAERRVEQIERRLAALRRNRVSKPVSRRAKTDSTGIAPRSQTQSADAVPNIEISGGETVCEPAAAECRSRDSIEMQAVDSASKIAMTDSGRTEGQGSVSVKTVRRPDPRKVAKAWRASSKPGFRNPGSKNAGRSELQSAIRE